MTKDGEMVMVSIDRSLPTNQATRQNNHITLVATGLAEESRELVMRSIPECHILESMPNSWRTMRFCKLVGSAILIMDYEALEQFGAEQIRELEYLSTVEVLVLSSYSDESVYKAALLAGCSGVLEPGTSPHQLRKVVDTIQEGQLWYPRAILMTLARRWMLSQKISRTKLTEREREILRLLGNDHNNQEIADQLFITRETVRWHLRTLYAKIGANNRSEAQLYALRQEESTRAL